MKKNTQDMEISFINKLVIQGNSYCVRIPKPWIDKLGLRKGELIDVTIRKPKEEMALEELLKPYKKHLPQLKNFSLKDINSCLFYTGMESMSVEGEKGEELKRMKEEFEEKLKEERGEEFLEKYRIFKDAMKNREAMKKIIEDSMQSSPGFKESFELGMKTIKEKKE